MAVINSGCTYRQFIDHCISPTAAHNFLRLCIHRGLIDESHWVRLYKQDFLRVNGTNIYKKIRREVIMKGDREFQRAVVERDGKCCRCGKYGLRNDKGEIENLSAHHLVRRKFLRTRHLPENGVSLCVECHQWAHKHPDNDRWLACERPEAIFAPLDWYDFKKSASHSSVINDEI